MLTVGFAERDITPPAGAPFGGFALERLAAAEGAHDRLIASAFACAAGDAAVIFVACDLQLVTADLVAAAREEIEAELGLPPDAVMIHATHDHAAPGGDASETGIAGADPEFGPPDVFELVLGGVVGAAVEAFERARPARLRLHRGDIDGIARRRHDPVSPGSVPAALLICETADGTPIGAVAHAACHPSVLGPDNTLFTADFPGVVRAELSALLGGAPVLYVNGPAGDLSTRHTRREATFSEMLRLGSGLADEIWRLTGTAAVEIGGDTVAFARRSIELPLAPLPSDDDLQRRVNDAEAAEALAPGVDARLRLSRARFEAERAARLRPLGKQVPVEVQAFRIGDLRWLGIAGEPVSELGDRIAEAAPGPLLIAAPANGSVGVVVPRHYAGPERGILGPDAGERLVWATLGFLQRREFA